MSVARDPFRFPFHPPSLALPVSRADYLTRDLTATQKDTIFGGGVKIAATAFGLAGLIRLYARKRAKDAARAAAAAGANGDFSAAGEEAAADDDAANRPAEVDDDDDDEAALDALTQSFQRRTTLPPESHIDELRKKPRKSHLPASRRLSGASSMMVEPTGPAPTAPFSIGIVTPTSLERYGALLAQGFGEVVRRDAGQPDAVLSRVELLVPTADESHSQFAARVRALNLDIMLIQYHGSSSEDVIAFLDYGFSARILLLHRPEEILERHAQHVFKVRHTREAPNRRDSLRSRMYACRHLSLIYPSLVPASSSPPQADQFNIVTLLREVECAVILGEAARPALLRQFPDPSLANICCVPHGFSGLDESLARSRKLTPVTVVGAVTAWGDMRWLADLLELNATVQSAAAAQDAAHAKRIASGATPLKNAKPKAQVVVYAAGHFQTYTDLHTKAVIDQYADITKRFPDRVALHSKAEFLAAESRGEITDVASLKSYLWRLSDSGRRVVLCNDDLFDSPLHTQVFDFSTQLYREHLKEFAPKIEYSGALHAQPGAAMPIVFECPAMGDVEIEGLQMVIVPYPSASDALTSEEQCAVDCPWYARSSQRPDFQPAAAAILRYINIPSHFNSHRQANFAAAQQLTMRAVAGQYQQIVRQIMGI